MAGPDGLCRISASARNAIKKSAKPLYSGKNSNNTTAAKTSKNRQTSVPATKSNRWVTANYNGNGIKQRKSSDGKKTFKLKKSPLTAKPITKEACASPEGSNPELTVPRSKDARTLEPENIKETNIKHPAPSTKHQKTAEEEEDAFRARLARLETLLLGESKSDDCGLKETQHNSANEHSNFAEEPTTLEPPPASVVMECDKNEKNTINSSAQKRSTNTTSFFHVNTGVDVEEEKRRAEIESAVVALLKRTEPVNEARTVNSKTNLKVTAATNLHGFSNKALYSTGKPTTVPTRRAKYQAVK